MKYHEPTIYAYAAGLIDGEGSFVPYRRSRTVALKVSMTAREPIEWLHAKFGGTLSTPTQLKSGKTLYAWRLRRSDGLEALLVRLTPYLKVKQSQCEACLCLFGAHEPWERWSKAAEIAWQDCLVMNH